MSGRVIDIIQEQTSATSTEETTDFFSEEGSFERESILYEDNIEQYEEIDAEEVNVQYYTIINDLNKIQQLKGLNPKEMVEALGLDWILTFKRFDKASPGVSQRRVKKWIKECIIYGDGDERDILNHTTSAATGALLSGYENGLPVITSMTLAGAFRKAKKLQLSVGSTFIWKMLGGDQSNILFKYADDATWKNRTNLKEGLFQKEELLALLSTNFPQYEIASIVQKFSINNPTEDFTNLIFVFQLQMGNQYDGPADGVVSKEFINTLYENSKIDNKDKTELIIAYLISKYRSKNLLSYESDYLAQLNESSRNNPVDGLVHQLEKKNGQYFRTIGGNDFFRSYQTYYDPYADMNAKLFMAKQIVIENLIEIEKIGTKNQKDVCKSFSDDEITTLAQEIVNRTQKTRAKEVDEPILEEKEKEVKEVVQDYDAILSIGNLARLSGSSKLLGIYDYLLEIERFEKKTEECDPNQLGERKNWFVRQIKNLMIPYEESGMAPNGGGPYVYNKIKDTYEFTNNLLSPILHVGEFEQAKFDFKKYLIYQNGSQIAGIEQLSNNLSTLYTQHSNAKLLSNRFFSEGNLHKSLNETYLPAKESNSGIPLALYYYWDTDEQEYVVTSYVNPSSPRTVTGEKLKEALEKLEGYNELPLGTLRFYNPDIQEIDEIESDEDWSLEKTLSLVATIAAVAAIIAGAILLALPSGGSSLVAGSVAAVETVATYVAITSGITTAGLSMYRKSELGISTSGTISRDILSIVASAFPLLRGASKIKYLNRLTNITSKGYFIQLESGIGLADDVYSGIEYTEEVAQELGRIQALPENQQNEAILNMLAWALPQGLITFKSAYDNIKGLRTKGENNHSNVKKKSNHSEELKNEVSGPTQSENKNLVNNDGKLSSESSKSQQKDKVVHTPRTKELMKKYNLPPPGEGYRYAEITRNGVVEPIIKRVQAEGYQQKFLDQDPSGPYAYRIVDSRPTNKKLTEKEIYDIQSGPDDQIKEAADILQNSKQAQTLLEAKYFEDIELQSIIENSIRYGELSPTQLLEHLHFLMHKVPNKKLYDLTRQLAIGHLNGAKYKGAELTIRWLANQSEHFLMKLTEFEQSGNGRFYDLVIDDVRYEFKNDKNPLGSDLLKQMEVDLNEYGSLQEFSWKQKYVLAKTKINESTKSDVIKRFIKNNKDNPVIKTFIEQNLNHSNAYIPDKSLSGEAKENAFLEGYLDNIIILF